MTGNTGRTLRSLGALATAFLLIVAPVRSETLAEQQAKFAEAESIGLAQITATGKVTAIDVQKREVSLTETQGQKATLKVDKSIDHLDKIAVGDTVKAVYFITGTAEIRKATAEEEKKPLTILETNPLPKNPFGSDLKVYKAVTTIESIDAATASFVIKSAQGHNVAIKSKSTKNFKEFEVGDTVVVTYTEPIAASLEKVSAK